MCQLPDKECPNCTIGVLIDDGECLQCDNCSYCEVYVDVDFEYESRKNGDYD